MNTAIAVAITLDEAGTSMIGTAIEVTDQMKAGTIPEPWRRFPISIVPTSPDYREAGRWLLTRAADSRPETGGFGLSTPGRRAQVLVDVSHRLYGMPLLEAVWGSEARRKWQIRCRGVVEVEADIVVPEDAGPRVKIGRGAMVSALAQATRAGLLRFARSEEDLIREWETYNRATVAGEKQAPPRIQALKLAAWGAAILHRRLMAGRPRASA